MSREFKFRAWNKSGNKMIAPRDGDFIGWHSMSNWKDCLEVMQFTGLTDKNGVEIYEGDIMQDPEDPGNPYTVFWCEQSAQWQTHCEESSTCSIFETNEALVEYAPSDEVIGNIHENPELIQ